MGLSSSPRIFTKVMKPVLAKLRQKGNINSGFIDDLYLQGQEFSDCTVNLSDTGRLFFFSVMMLCTQVNMMYVLLL